ncbi:O-methyltransferase [Aeromicrobium erythreum]|uniref:O-methyltransferase n=1 Tax=Aeromicrobium erythreum TaxID=2041 RepID=UPI00082CA882|nr:class I SAM-dependent methyltransferase [Aeromicrobium erythreum]
MTSTVHRPAGDDGSQVLRPVTPVGIAAQEVGLVLDGLDAGLPVDDDVLARLRRAHALLAGLDPYVAASTSPESAQLAELARTTAGHRWGEHPPGAAQLEPEMVSGHVEAALMQLLVRLSGARRVLEIGTFTGYAALAVAEALPADGVVVTCEADPRAAAVARDAFARSDDGDRIELLEGPALASLEQFGEPFDLVFVDADKEGYSAYLDLLLERGLLADGALVAVDNTLMQGVAYGAPPRSEREAEQGRVIAAFNERVASDPSLVQVVLPVRDGLTLLQRRADG